ncbi:TPA: hypothetical protein EYP44_02850 [Candidatus Bathyarchaeota archaeon]|nr:hypothetical protein [Candidatus Bathyarchaeota archaeon]
MSLEWFQKVSRRQPMSEQELSVADVLGEVGVAYEVHKAFDLGRSGLISVDFYVGSLSRPTVIECVYTSCRQGTALSFLRRQALWVDWKFARLKERIPMAVCIALVEAPRVRERRLRGAITPFLSHADRVAFSCRGLRGILRSLGSWGG